MEKILLVTLISIFFFSPVHGKDNKGDKTQRKEVVLAKREPKYNDRPRAPQRHSSVECYYQNGVISIEFETPEGDATFTVTDVMTGDNASTTFNTAVEFNYYIGTTPSTYLLEISTSAGNAYEGYLTLD